MTLQIMNSLSNSITLERNSVSPEVCVFADDPIALSCAAYRNWKNNPAVRWPDLNDMVAEPQDYQQSQAIRKYYADRLILSLLQQEHEISGFRRKLYGLVTDSIRLTKQEIGMLYRLPYFYAEDTGMDYVVSQTQPVSPVTSHEITDVFSLLKRISVSRRSGEGVQFWLQRPNDTGAYLIAVKADNPMLDLLDSMFEQPRQLSCRAYAKNYRGHHRYHTHYQLGSVRLVNASA
jgi:hypothetical protein